VLTTLTLWLACSTPSAPGEVADDDGRADTLVVALQTDISSLLTPVSTTAQDARLYENLLISLVEPVFDCGLSFTPSLAKGWTWAEDGLSVTFDMRDDVTWSDGTTVTARDVAVSYELVQDPLVASPYLDWVERMVPGTPVVVDDHTVRFEFTSRYAQTTMLAHAGIFRIIHAGSVEGADRATLRGHPITRAPIVNGAWDLQDFKPGERLTLVPNPAYSGDEPARLNRVVFKTLPEYATRILELESGSVDMVQAVQIEDAERLRVEHPELEIVRRGWRSTDFLAWNRFDAADYQARRAAAGDADVDWDTVAPHPALSDRQVRRALSMAIDVDKLIADLLTDGTGLSVGKRALSTLSPAFCGAQPAVTPLPFSPDLAKALLAERGWVDSDGDGVRDKDGRALELRLLTNSGNPRRASAAVAIQAMLRNVGVVIEIDKLEANTFFARLRKKDFEVALSGWSVALFPDPAGIWHSGDRYVYNYPSYQNSEVDALIEQHSSEPDPERGAELLAKIGQLVYEDQPYTFLYWRDDLVAVHRRFQDRQVDFLSQWGHLNRWWVKPEDVKYAR